jgi:hypothetical protein
MKKKTTIDPEQLSAEERRAILERAAKSIRREMENEMIVRQLEREAVQEERREAS